MLNLFKKLFCKHEWVILNAETPIEKNIVDGNLQYKCKIGVQVMCSKCNKIHKGATKVLKQIKIREIQEQMFTEGYMIASDMIKKYKIKGE